MAVVMRAGFGIGPDGHGTRPQFLRPDAGEIDRGLAVHAGGRGHVGIELIAGNDPHAIVLPAFGVVMMVVIVRVRMAVVVGHCAAFDRFRPYPYKIPRFPERRAPELFCDGHVGDTNEDFRGRRCMSSTTDKIKGTANEAMGKAKQGIGEATGSDKMKGEGAVQEIKGKGQKTMGDAKDAAKDAVDRAAASAKRAAD
jgi:uncharacterized protein YjbJ (UPF0337 family)